MEQAASILECLRAVGANRVSCLFCIFSFA